MFTIRTVLGKTLLICLMICSITSCNIIENMKINKSAKIVDAEAPTELELLSQKNDFLTNKIKYLSIRHNHIEPIKEDNFDTFWLEMTQVTAQKFNNEIIVTYEITNLGKKKILGMSGYGQVLKIGNKEIIGCGTTGTRFGCDRMAVYQKDVQFSNVIIGRQKFEIEDKVTILDSLQLMCKVDGSNHFVNFSNVPVEWH